ncbi:MAG: tetraacyldisaccharide 4'-kinase [Flavobacteriales bacterium]|nr:tetraacyldisaccharide 4'-kinase [Flavobacteriales bacterium]
MKLLRFLLLPITLVYVGITMLRNLFYDVGIFGSSRYQLAVIGIGNLSLGGTGKSPHVEYLLRFLADKFQTATLSRGYGRKTSGYLEVGANSTFIEVGDEPRMLKNKFPNASVVVDANRRRGIKKIMEKHQETQVILLDDAFQHRAVQPGMNILLTDYSKLYIDDLVVPTGSLREIARGALRADMIIVTKCPSIFSPVDARGIRKRLKVRPYQSVYFSYFKYGKLKTVYAKKDKEKKKEIPEFKKSTNVLLFTGIAKSANLVYHLKDQVNQVQHIRFGDHHTFQINDIQRIIKEFEALKGGDKFILTTEKDAMRLQMPGIVELLGNLPIYYIPIQVEFHGKDKVEFEEQIMNYVKRYSKAD